MEGLMCLSTLCGCAAEPGLCAVVLGAAATATGVVSRAGPAISRHANTIRMWSVGARTTVRNIACQIGDTLQGIGHALGPNAQYLAQQGRANVHNVVTLPIVHIARAGSQGRMAAQKFNELMAEFNDLVFRLAGLDGMNVTSVSGERLRRAYDEAVRIMGFNPDRFIW